MSGVTISYDVIVEPISGDCCGAIEDAAEAVARRVGMRLSEAYQRVDTEVRRAAQTPLRMWIRVGSDGTVKATVGPSWLKPVVGNFGESTITGTEGK